MHADTFVKSDEFNIENTMGIGFPIDPNASNIAKYLKVTNIVISEKNNVS